MNQTPNRIIAAILAITLGIFGIHKFYMRDYGAGAVMLLSGVLLSWTVIVPLIIAFIAFFQGLGYLLETDSQWQRRFKK